MRGSEAMAVRELINVHDKHVWAFLIILIILTAFISMLLLAADEGCHNCERHRMIFSKFVACLNCCEILRNVGTVI